MARFASLNRRLTELESRGEGRKGVLHFLDGSTSVIHVRNPLGLIIAAMNMIHFFAYDRFDDPPQARPDATLQQIDLVRLIGRAQRISGGLPPVLHGLCQEAVELGQLETAQAVEKFHYDRTKAIVTESVSEGR